MPVTAVPTAVATNPCCDSIPTSLVLSTVPCVGQNVLSAPISEIYKKPLLNRMRALAITGGQEAIIDWQMHDPDGNPVDLRECLEPNSSCSASDGPLVLPGDSLGSACRAPFSLKLRIRESLSIGQWPEPGSFEFPAYVVNAAEGRIRARIAGNATNIPGVYFAQVALTGVDENAVEYVLFANTFFLYIDRSMWSRRGPYGPPALAEIRLHLRDSEGAENFLLDNLKFDVAEIALAAERCVQYWNEIPPPLGPMTTQTFPYRFHWLEGICGQLFMMIGEQFRANNLQYSAAGVAVNDQDKEQVYENAALRRWGVYTDFVRRKKVELNLNACFGGIGSPYQFYGYRSLPGATVY